MFTKKNQGFTLLELMIVVAILGVIAAMALASYSNYIDTTQATSLNANFEAAVDTARGNYMAAENLNTLGVDVSEAIPPDSAGWVDLMNRFPSSAPEGGVAYQAGTGDGATGTVGLVFTGTYAGNNSALTVHRPAYNGMPATSVMIAQTDL